MKQLYASAVFYPTLWWNVLLGRIICVRNWWDDVNEHVVLGALPFESDVENLADVGIGAVVNTCVEYGGPVNAYKEFGIEQLRVPTTDFTHPSLQSVEKAVDFMEQQIENGKRVYVHCKAGRARSATVVACWLIKRFQMTANDAQQLMLKVRPHVNPKIELRPVVIEFEQKHRSKS